jgi:hypothetical protein
MISHYFILGLISFFLGLVFRWLPDEPENILEDYSTRDKYIPSNHPFRDPPVNYVPIPKTRNVQERLSIDNRPRLHYCTECLKDLGRGRATTK